MRNWIMLIAVAFLIGWTCLAFWVRKRQLTVLRPDWRVRSLIFVGVTYALGLLLIALG